MTEASGATRPLRCAIVTPYGTLGGSEYWLLDLLDTSARMDAEVILLQDGPLRQELEARQIATVVMATGRTATSVARRAWGLSRRLRNAEVDVVLASGVKAAAVAVPASRLVGVPVVWAKHDFSWDQRLAGPLATLADGVVANSEAVAAATRRPDAVVIPPPRPDWGEPSRDAALHHWKRAGHPLPAQGQTVAMVGRLVSYKGIDTAIRALAEAPGSWTLVVIGPADPSEPREEERLRRLASSLHVGDRVMFVPETPQAGRWLAAFDAVAVLTRQEASGFGREGYSIVALEALAAGVPLLGAAGNPEVERMAAAAGIVVPANDPAALARALRQLGEPERRADLGSRGREVVASHPNAATTADRVIALLAEHAGRPGAGLSGPPVTVLTCLRNEEGHVDGVMREVTQQLRADDEYLVVDDGSTDSTADEIARWAKRDVRIRVLSGPAVNLAAARNHGFRAAGNQIVACTDAGCVPGPDWLSALAAPFAEQSPADLVVGVFTVPGGSTVKDAFSLADFPSVAEARRRTPFVRIFGRLFGRAFSADRLDGRSMAVTVDAWRTAQGFDESLYSSEDAVFGHAVLSAGARSVLALDADVAWEQPATVTELATTFRKYGEWAARARDWRLVRRDLLRAASYAAAPVVVVRGGPLGRTVLAVGAASYLSLPVARAVQVRASPLTFALIPGALLLKDLAKAWGCVRGLAPRAIDDRGATRVQHAAP